MKRGLVALVAAALMMTAAFAVAAGLDQRLMDYFGIGQEDLNLVSNGIVQVDKTHAYKNGWTVEVKQLLFDRYCGEILVDLTAPEGTVLTEQVKVIHGIPPPELLSVFFVPGPARCGQ